MATIWCDQEQATRRRTDLQSSLERLVWVGTLGKGHQCNVSIPDVMVSRPDLTKWLLEMWSLPPSWLQAAEAHTPNTEEFKYKIQAAKMSVNGIWVRQGVFAGEVEDGGL